jgi:hypothetical protein
MKRAQSRVLRLQSVKEVPHSLPLGPGLHAGQVETQKGTQWQLRLLDGRVFSASLGPAVSPALLEEAAVDGRLVIVTEGAQGPIILGALQTAPTISPNAEGVLELRLRRLSIETTEELRLGSKQSSLELRADGKTRLRSRRVLIDAPDHVKVRSALVELP